MNNKSQENAHQSQSLLAEVIALADSTVGKEMTDEEVAELQRRVREAFAKSGKVYPRRPRYPQSPQ